MSPSPLLTAGRIVTLVEPANNDTMLETAARLLCGDSPANTTLITDSLQARERMGSTAIGYGIAIPHGRSAAFDEARGAFLRLTHPIDFGASDGQPVDLVFALAVPEHFTQQHLQLLAELSERFSDADYRAALRAAPDIDALHALLTSGRTSRSAAA